MGKTYIFKAERGYRGGEDQFVAGLVDSFAKIMAEEIEEKGKEILMEAILPKYRGHKMAVKLERAFDNFIENADFYLCKEEVEQVIKERDEAVSKAKELQELWHGFVCAYQLLDVSGKGATVSGLAETMRSISLIFDEEKNNV